MVDCTYLWTTCEAVTPYALGRKSVLYFVIAIDGCGELAKYGFKFLCSLGLR